MIDAHFDHHRLSFNKAPVGVITEGASTSSIKVIFPALAPGSQLDEYFAELKGASNECSVNTTAVNLTCDVQKLSAPGSVYTLLAYSSIPGSGPLFHSGKAEVQGYTLPTGKKELFNRETYFKCFTVALLYSPRRAGYRYRNNQP